MNSEWKNPQIISQIARRASGRRISAAALCFIAVGCGSNSRPPPPGSVDGLGGASGSALDDSQGAAELSTGAGGGSMTTGMGTGGAALSGDGMSGGAGGLGGGQSTTGAGGAGFGSGGGGAGNLPSTPSDTSCQASVECLQLCAGVNGDASCGLGNRAQCACICENRLSGPCPDELETLVECVAGEPDVDCATRGLVFGGCEPESLALEACEVRSIEQACASSLPNCSNLCVPLTLAFCPQGPETVSSCLCGCETTFEVLCRTQFDAFMACSNEQPDFQCSPQGLPGPSTCSDEWSELMGCQTVQLPSN